ncbi:hypothetical protein BDN70DRAFT_876767 [Pholiota conissans]|uniref:F-box domain-containing protein n=1 Tax=Pholiota conissans TaxID=109636 RepID=A0A9P5Z6S1_9AGAR|nr:hypothetical protein BDN70DRAFT_876767 [Pholiota conissans]
MNASAAAFDALPLELLWAIFDFANANTILNIAKTCRRFNTIAVPIFYQKLNKVPPKESVTIRPIHNDHGDLLSGLTIDFSIHSLKHFLCILNNKQMNSPDGHEDYRKLSPIEGLRRSIQRVNQLISRLDYVGTICIIFFPIGGFWSLRSSVVVDFVTAFFELLNTIALKPCGALRILHPHPLTTKPVYKFQLFKDTDLENILIKSLTKMKLRDNELEGNGWKYKEMFKYSAVPALPCSLTTRIKLTTLELNSDFLLLPPFSSWTFTMMKQSYITSLSIYLQAGVISRDEFYHYIFPHIIDALPGLQELRLAANADGFVVAAIEFLPKLPLLRKVTFGASQYGCFPPPSYELSTSAQPRLSNLCAFTGYIDQATYLLGNIICPKLSAVNLIIDDTRGHAHYPSIAMKLSALKARLAKMGMAPKFNVCLSNNGYVKPQSSVAEDRDWSGFSVVSLLTLELPITEKDDTSFIRQMEYVMEWLDIFTGLNGLTLTTRQPYQESELLTNMVTAEYPQITTFNIVDYPGVFHYHWSSAPNDMRRAIVRRSDLPNFRNTSIEDCVCAEF